MRGKAARLLGTPRLRSFDPLQLPRVGHRVPLAVPRNADAPTTRGHYPVPHSSPDTALEISIPLDVHLPVLELVLAIDLLSTPSTWRAVRWLQHKRVSLLRQRNRDGMKRRGGRWEGWVDPGAYRVAVLRHALVDAYPGLGGIIEVSPASSHTALGLALAILSAKMVCMNSSWSMVCTKRRQRRGDRGCLLACGCYEARVCKRRTTTGSVSTEQDGGTCSRGLISLQVCNRHLWVSNGQSLGWLRLLHIRCRHGRRAAHHHRHSQQTQTPKSHWRKRWFANP